MTDPEATSAAKLARTIGLLGVAFATCFLGALALLTTAPDPGATDAEAAAFYGGPDTRWVLLGGLYLAPLSAVAFLWLLGALRAWTARSTASPDQMLTTAQASSGVAFVALTFVGAGAAVVAAGSGPDQAPASPELARLFPDFGRTILVVFAMRMAAVFIGTTARIGHDAGLLPRWFAVGSVGIAVALFVVPTRRVEVMALFPLWVLALTGIVWTNLHRAARPLATPPSP